MINRDQNYGLITIKTARTKEAINQAVKEGFWPLIKRVVPSQNIRSKYLVRQNKRTGIIEVECDYRFRGNEDAELDTVIDFTFYYPHHFESPYAAYLIPPNLQVGAHVWVEDLIEDFVSVKGGQGDCFRLPSCEAFWTGNNLVIEYSENSDAQTAIG